MKKINLLKVGAVLTAVSVILSASVCNFRYALPYNINKTSKPIAPTTTVLEDVTSSDLETACVQKITSAHKKGNYNEINEACDILIDSINDTKEELEQTSQLVEQWNNAEITARLEKYENELNVKSAQTIQALNELKNGINVEDNIDVISKNLYEDDGDCYSDAAPNTECSIDNIDTMNILNLENGIRITSPAPTDDDLNYSVLTNKPETLKAVADSFDDVNDLYLFVKNTISYENYSGSKKDPLIMIEQLGGNELDQASLLIALLRAKGIPARFVEGTIQITAEQAIDITGAVNAEVAGRLLASNSNNTIGLTCNGELVGYRMKRVWVEAYIPYTDYRGAGNKNGESIWVQLDPSFKNVVPVTESITPEFSDSDLARLNDVKSAAEQYPNILDTSKYTIPDTINYYYQEIEEEKGEYIPSTLPYTVLSVDERYQSIDNADKDSISISINGEPIFNAPVSELCYEQITVSYEPASSVDREIMDEYEKITDVPAYLVYVVPVVTVGDKKYYGEFENPLGSSQRMVTTIKNNGGTTMLNDTVYCGSMYAINLNLQRISPNEAQKAQDRIKNAYENFTVKNVCTPGELGALLDYAGKYYFSLCDSQTLLYSGIMNIDETKQLGVAITGYQFTANSLFGVTKSLDTGSFYIDVAYNSVKAISYDGNKANEKNFMTTVGTLESYFEGYVWEQLLKSESTCISTVSVLAAAHELGIPSRFICKNNLEEELSLCNVSDSVKNEVRNFVNQGLAIEIVPETLTMGDWVGTAYIAINLNDGSASYMISGGNAGGSSMNFEDLFMLNNTLALINVEMSVCSLTMGAAKYYSGLLTGNGKDLVQGAHGCISAAFSIGSAFTMRYANYDFIFDYAERGEEIMREYKIFTLQNLINTYVNLVNLVGSACGDAVATATGWFATEYAFFDFMAKSFDNNDENNPGFTDTVALLLDLIGKLL